MTTLQVTHVEWATTQLETLKDFLSRLFGWPFRSFGEGYYVYNPGDGVSVGLMHNPRANAAGSPNVYLKVESIDDCLSTAQSLGGEVAVPRTKMGDVGSFAFIKAPDGNLIGLYEVAPRPSLPRDKSELVSRIQAEWDALQTEDDTNDFIFKRSQKRSTDEVLADLRRTHEELLAQLERMSFDDLMQPRYAGDAEKRPVINWVIGNTYEHYPEHRANIEAILSHP